LDLSGFTLTALGSDTLYLNTRFASTVAGSVQVSSGTVAGSGWVAGDLANFSAVAPGKDGVGTRTINGNYLQSASGHLYMKIGDQGHDLVQAIAGNLDGVFELSVLEGFIPQPNTTFQLLAFSTVSGQFDTLDLQTLPGGLSWVTTDLETLGQVSVIGLLGDFDFNDVLELSDINELVAAIAAGSTDPFYDVTGDSLINGDDLNHGIVDIFGTLPGDANLDHAVDRLDIQLWDNHKFTSTVAWGNGNFDGNSVVDVRDFNVWNEFKYSSIPPPVVSLPEPSSGMLLGLSFLAMIGRSFFWHDR